MELQNQELINENRALNTLVKRLEKQRDQLNLQLKEYKRKEASVDKLHADLLLLSTECEEYKEKVATWERKHEVLKKNYEKQLRESQQGIFFSPLSFFPCVSVYLSFLFFLKTDTTPLEKSLNETTAKVVELKEFIEGLQEELQRQKKNEERTQRVCI